MRTDDLDGLAALHRHVEPDPVAGPADGGRRELAAQLDGRRVRIEIGRLVQGRDPERAARGGRARRGGPGRIDEVDGRADRAAERPADPADELREEAGASDERHLQGLELSPIDGLPIGVKDIIDTADMYGPFTNEELVGRALAGRRDQVVLATKFGIERTADGGWVGVNGRPEYVRAACDASLPNRPRRGAREPARIFSSRVMSFGVVIGGSFLLASDCNVHPRHEQRP